MNNTTNQKRFSIFPTLERDGRIELVQYFEK